MNGNDLALPSRGGRIALRGGVISYVALLIVIPMAALVRAGLADGLDGLVRAVMAPPALHAIVLTIWTGVAITLVNAVAGTATAWVLVRYTFPGRALLSALVDLPFAIPTLVTGLMLGLVFGPTRSLGGWLGAHGITVMYAIPAIALALMFITVPFVVRAVEPVLEEIDPAEEEAALTLGASSATIFRRVVLPALARPIAYGSLQSFARALAEFGSVVVVSGNIPFRTLTAPVYLYGEVESGRSDVAAAVSIALLAIALLVSILARAVRHRASGPTLPTSGDD
jgi:sulfate/thiosulfate transport system permease protein